MKLLIRVARPDFILIERLFLLIARLKHNLQSHRGRKSQTDEAQRDSVSSLVPRCFLIEEDVRASQAANIASGQIPCEPDRSFPRWSEIVAGPCADTGEKWVCADLREDDGEVECANVFYDSRGECDRKDYERSCDEWESSFEAIRHASRYPRRHTTAEVRWDRQKLSYRRRESKLLDDLQHGELEGGIRYGICPRHDNSSSNFPVKDRAKEEFPGELVALFCRSDNSVCD